MSFPAFPDCWNHAGIAFYYYFCTVLVSDFIHQESVVLVSRFFAFSSVSEFYEMQKPQLFFLRPKNNNRVFSIYARYQGFSVI